MPSPFFCIITIIQIQFFVFTSTLASPLRLFFFNFHNTLNSSFTSALTPTPDRTSPNFSFHFHNNFNFTSILTSPPPPQPRTLRLQFHNNFNSSFTSTLTTPSHPDPFKRFFFCVFTITLIILPHPQKGPHPPTHLFFAFSQ